MYLVSCPLTTDWVGVVVVVVLLFVVAGRSGVLLITVSTARPRRRAATLAGDGCDGRAMGDGRATQWAAMNGAAGGGGWQGWRVNDAGAPRRPHQCNQQPSAGGGTVRFVDDDDEPRSARLRSWQGSPARKLRRRHPGLTDPDDCTGTAVGGRAPRMCEGRYYPGMCKMEVRMPALTSSLRVRSD